MSDFTDPAAAYIWADKEQLMAQASAQLEAAEALLKAEEERTKAAGVATVSKVIYMPGFDDPAAAAEAWIEEYRAKQKAREQEQLIDPYELIAGVL